MRFFYFLSLLSILSPPPFAHAAPGKEESLRAPFYRHIGMPSGPQGKKGEGVRVAIIEGGYVPEFQHTGKVVYASALLNPPAKTFEEVTTPVFKDPEAQLLFDLVQKHQGVSSIQGPSQDRTLIPVTCHTEGTVSNPIRTLSITGRQSVTNALRLLTAGHLAEISLVKSLEQNLEDFLTGGYDKFAFEENKTHAEIYGGEVMASHTVRMRLSGKRDEDLEEIESLELKVTTESHVDSGAIREKMDAIAEDQRESAGHGRDITETFFAIAPRSEAALYHPAELETVATEDNSPIVSYSGSVTSLAEEKSFRERLQSFSGSGKLLVLSLDNDHTRLRDSEKWLEILQLCKDSHHLGFEMVLCSSASVVDDETLGNVGNVGNYIEQGDTDIQGHYMTAPGYGVHLFGDEPLFGCSISTPCVAGAAALLLSQHPELSAFHLKQILVNSGRKQMIGANEFHVEISSVQKTAFLEKASRLNVGVDPRAPLNQQYATAVETLTRKLEEQDIFKSVMGDDLLRWHVLTAKDHKKFKNHLAIGQALELAAVERQSD